MHNRHCIMVNCWSKRTQPEDSIWRWNAIRRLNTSTKQGGSRGDTQRNEKAIWPDVIPVEVSFTTVFLLVRSSTAMNSRGLSTLPWLQSWPQTHPKLLLPPPLLLLSSRTCPQPSSLFVLLLRSTGASPSPSLGVLCQKLSPCRRTQEPCYREQPLSSQPSVSGRTSHLQSYSIDPMPDCGPWAPNRRFSHIMTTIGVKKSCIRPTLLSPFPFCLVEPTKKLRCYYYYLLNTHSKEHC